MVFRYFFAETTPHDDVLAWLRMKPIFMSLNVFELFAGIISNNVCVLESMVVPLFALCTHLIFISFTGMGFLLVIVKFASIIVS